MKRTVGQAARALLIAAIALEVVWLLAANAVLAAHLIPRAIAHASGRLFIDYAQAWSLYPGDLHVRRFEIRGNTRQGLEFDAAADRADAYVSLPALCWKTFRTTRLDASGVSFHFRRRVSPEQVEERRGELAEWPRIRGFPDVPLMEAGPERDYRHLTKRYWRVDLEGGRLRHVRELWAMWLRVNGDGEASGRIQVWPHERVEIGPLTLSMPHATARAGDAVIAREVDLRAGGGLERYDPRDLKGAALFSRMTIAVDAAGQLAELTPVDELYRLPVRAESGTFGIHVASIAGQVQPGSSLDVKLPHAQVRAGPVTFAGALEASGRVDADGSARGLATLEGAQLRFSSLPNARMQGGALALGVQVDALELPRPPELTALVLRARHLEVRDLGGWSEVFPKALAIRSGSATVNGKLVFGARGHGNVRIRTSPVALELEGRPLNARADARVRLRSLRRAPLSADLAGTQLRLETSGGWWLESNLARARLQLSPLRASGELDARAPDATPLLRLMADSGALPKLAASTLKLPGLRVHAEGHYVERTLVLAPAHVSGGHTIFDAALRLGDSLDGAMLLHEGPASVALSVQHGKVKVASLGGSDWFRQQLDALKAPARAAARSPAARPRRR